MEKKAYYTILDNWYLTKYINIESNNIDKIMSNIKSLLIELQKLKRENLELKIRQESMQTPHGLVLFTQDKEVAEKVFTNGYHTTDITDLLNDIPIDSVNDQSLMPGGRSPVNDNTEEIKDSLSDAFAAVDNSEVRNENSQVEVEENLPDELFDDLEDIGLSTVESEAKPEDEGESLPDDLFQDLAERAESTVETEVKSEDEGAK